ncbi:MAG: S1 RNA-binding domain-containing protein [archaeon]|nr:MAG: S1 RNA-binding domain-containing protein [archaeon]
MSKEFPKVNKIILGTVDKIKIASVFIKLKDFPLSGVITFSEIAPGRIRNIRNYVKPGQKIAVKVLRVDTVKGHVDLSLRRVSQKEKKQAMESEKKEKELSVLLSLTTQDQDKIGKIMEGLKEYGISDFFEEVVKKEKESLKLLKEVGLTEKESIVLIGKIKEKVKTKKIYVKTKLSLKCFESDGMERIKKVLSVKEGIISYKSAPNYTLTVESLDYKSGNKKTENLIQELQKKAKQNNCEFNVLK